MVTTTGKDNKVSLSYRLLPIQEFSSLSCEEDILLCQYAYRLPPLAVCQIAEGKVLKVV